ncbi:MAG TPA: DUF2625 domain-containing protein [Gemmataceae bacterium]|nr:DUF2625 domain-containing protein [Gemmataceae bacterium]
MALRTLDELLERNEPAWPLVQQWLREATNPVEVLPASDPERAEALAAVQVTTRSPMGAVIYETGGLLIDHGWLRVLGSGHPRLLRSLSGWNKGRTRIDRPDLPAYCLIADDVLGGFFAANGGDLPGELRHVCYFAPDTLRWESLGIGYTQFLQWCFSGDLAGYYQEQRWPGWEADVSNLPGDQGFGVWPPLWAEGPPISERRRGSVPMAELYGMNVEELSKKL